MASPTERFEMMTLFKKNYREGKECAVRYFDNIRASLIDLKMVYINHKSLRFTLFISIFPITCS